MTAGRHALAALLLFAGAAPALGAQHDMHMHESSSPLDAAWGASAIVVGTQVDPGVNHRRLREGYLTQPMLHGQLVASGGVLSAQAMLDLEGATLKRGELDPGVYGEGYADRRHPHTWVHELVASVATPARWPVAASLSGGKGFAPFGTDDPMVRPLERFPINHHLAQILERALLVGAVRWRPVALEYGVFNGDEPESPTDAPNAGHFADSWATRVTLRPLPGFELQGSAARVESPESPSGHGFDHHKRSGSIRVERGTRLGVAYLLAEWAGTDMYNLGRKAFHLNTGLVEGSLDRGALRFAARWERSLRPEEERLANPFRTPYPTAEVQILGTTRFDVVSASVATAWRFAGVSIAPFVEGSLVHGAATVRPAAFVPSEFYGSSRITTISLGARLALGAPHHRVGRYGAAAEPMIH